PAVLPLQIARARELPGHHVGGGDIARLARAHDVVQRFERLLHRDRLVEAMEEVLARKAALIHSGAGRMEGLGAHDDVVAPGVLAQRAAEDRLALALGVHVGRVEEVDAELDGPTDDGAGVAFREYPALPRGIAEGKGAQAKARDL